MLQKAPKTYWSTCEQVPSVAATAYIADTATVTGHVEISEGVMVCPGASVRGDKGCRFLSARTVIFKTARYYTA